MKQQMKAIITILTLLVTQRQALPVTSKALDNNSDQLIWQTAWYSQRLNEGKKDDSPFTGDSKKITAKSIFITPNFNQNTSLCPPGFKIDDNGKCIKVVNVNQDDILVTRLQSFFAQHETTDDTTSIDYDYSVEDDNDADVESQEPTRFTLPLVPFLNENDTTLYTVNEPELSTVQYNIELVADDYSFRKSNHSENRTDSTSVAATTAATTAVLTPTDDNPPNQNTTDDEDQTKSSIGWDENSDRTVNQNNSSSSETETETKKETHVDEKNINLNENYDTTTVESVTSLEESDTTLVEMEMPETTTTSATAQPVDSRDTLSFEDQFDEDDNYKTTTMTTTTTTMNELAVNKSESFDEKLQAEKAINDTTDAPAIHLDDYFDTILLNDSLLIDENFYENGTEADYDVTTITSLFESVADISNDSPANVSRVDGETTTKVELLSSATIESLVEDFSQHKNFPYESRIVGIVKDDEQNADLENVEASNKFVYHHLPATQNFVADVSTSSPSLATPTTVIRFPLAAPPVVHHVDERHRVRFPDDRPSFSWPKDNSHQTAGVMRFWQAQPLINDYKLVSRGNSRGPSGRFNRQQSYRWSYR